MLQIPNLNAEECATLILYNWGDKFITPKLENLTDGELISVLKIKYNSKWELIANYDSSEIGAIETKVITDTETVKGVITDESVRTKSESALNVDSYIETDKTDFNKTKNDDTVTTKERKEILIDNRLKHKNIVEHSFDLCYTVSEDIANALTLDFY